ncbi:MAG: lysophospholipid acyltransferase family protein [Sulfurimonas sp.]|nr:lysophospholipid acyltransferase family protein [Sulfurimonas sp.]
MYPVTFFYFIFAKNVKESLKIYYKHLDIKFTNAIYYEHLRIFAITMVDRFITKVDSKSYTFICDDDKLLKILSNATILVQSHFGGWASSANVSKTENKVNIVMQEVLMDSIKSIEKSIEIKENVNIIDLSSGGISVSLQIANALNNNEIVGIMGDRAANKNSTIAIDFLGEKANFNKNPFQIAYKMDKPVLIYFVIYLDIRLYKIDFIEIEIDKSKNKDEAIREAIGIYVKKYEDIVLKYSNQWLNFYDFWDKDESI